MKILVFTSLYPNNVWTHHGVFVKERMTHVARLNGCEVKVVAPVAYFPPIKISRRWQFSQVTRREYIEGVEVYHPPYFMIPKIGMALQGFMMFLAAVPLLKRIQRDFDFDIIDAHYVYPDGFAAILLAGLFRRPVVVSARGTDINVFPSFPLVRQLLKITLSRADRLIAVSQALKMAMRTLEVPDQKVSVIPNGVDTTKFHPVPKSEARARLRLPQDKRILLSVGGLVPGKGFQLLVKALRILREQCQQQDLMLIIVGEGPLRPELEKLIETLKLQEHVKLPGDVPHRELCLWYNAADLFCLASSREGWPNVILEALACGVPVVATQVGGIPEIIHSRQLGHLTEQDEASIAQSIVEALKESWQTQRIVDYAKQHSWERVAVSVQSVLRSAMDGKNP